MASGRDMKGDLEARVARVEGILEEVRTRLNHLETRFNWLLGILITMWVTIMVSIWLDRLL